MLAPFQAAAFFVSLEPLEDSVHHNVDVWEGTHLGYGGMGATVQRSLMRKFGRCLILRCEAARKLLQLRQDSRSVADCAVDFRLLAADCAWNPEALFDMFLHGLSEVVKDELAAGSYP